MLTGSSPAPTSMPGEPDVHLTAVKELRAAGVRAEFLHPADQRIGLGEYSAEVVFAFAIGVAQNMTWDAAKAVWHYVRSRAASYASAEQVPLVRLDVMRLHRDGLEVGGLSLTAPADDSTAEAFLRMLVGEPKQATTVTEADSDE